MHRGYVKLWRKTLESGVIQNPHLLQFWVWCLVKATHRPIKIMVGFQEVELKPGEFVFGRRSCAEDLKVGEQTVRTCLSNLLGNQQLTIKSTNKFSIISVTNWATYQNCEDSTNQAASQQTNQPVTSSQPAANHKQEQQEQKEGTTLFGMPAPAPRKRKSLTTDYSAEFLRWYKLYPVQKKKQDAWVLWQAIKDKPDVDSMVKVLEAQSSSQDWVKENGKYVPHPDKYLRGRRWEDRCRPASSGPTYGQGGNYV